MFRLEFVPPDIPYQRAILLFQDNKETLVLQSRYQLEGGTQTNELGWVVPVPSVPELATIPPEQANHFFRMLDVFSSPHRISLFQWAGPALLILTLVLWILYIFLDILVTFYPGAHSAWVVSRKLAKRSLICIPLGFVWALIIPSMTTASSLGSPVEIISSQQVGRYDTKVIRAQTAEDIVAWLQEHAFAFGEQDIQAFESYISREWVFVVARLKLGSEDEQDLNFLDGLPDPLILTFSTPNPVYPLALTGTGGFDTEVLLYVIAEQEMHAHDMMKRRYAGGTHQAWLNKTLATLFHRPGEQTPAEMKFETPILTKFKETLSPEDMRKDLILHPVQPHTPYRETVWGW